MLSFGSPNHWSKTTDGDLPANYRSNSLLTADMFDAIGC